MAAGAVAVALLWPCVALVRGTTAHDWYAAVKLTVTEAMIAVGFNSFEPTRYRAPDGTSFPFPGRQVLRARRVLREGRSGAPGGQRMGGPRRGRARA